MAKQTIGIGSNPNDKTGDTLRSAFDKVNDNFTEVYQADADEITNRTAADAALQTQIDDLEAAQDSGVIGFDDKSDMDADLAHDAGTVAIVMNDATASNNAYYRKSGASGSGGWVKRNDFYATTLDESDTGEAVTGKAVSDYVYDTAQRAKEMVASEAFDATNITLSANDNIASADLLWHDGISGSISNLVEDGNGQLTSLRFNRQTGKYVTITVDYSGTFPEITRTATGY